MGAARVAVVIEDDKDVLELIQAVLQQSGFEVHAVGCGVDGVEAVRRHQPSVITLDIGLPDIDGFEVARQVRLFSDSYIIMLTARGEELDTVLGLESGADDYLTKPFRPRELRARIAAMLRRPRAGYPSEETRAGAVDLASGYWSLDAVVPDERWDPGATAAAVAVLNGPPRQSIGGTKGFFVHNELALDPAARTVHVDGAEVELTRTEFDLLFELMQSGRTVRTKANLARRLRGDAYDTGGYVSESDERAIEVHMGNLRRKLGDDAKTPRWLRTIRGAGYCLAPAAASVSRWCGALEPSRNPVSN